MVGYSIHLLFVCYYLMLLVRVIGSWFPSFRYHLVMRFIAHYTDPYLNIFRRVIPPIGGVLDLSPLLGFFVLRLLEQFIMSIFR